MGTQKLASCVSKMNAYMLKISQDGQDLLTRMESIPSYEQIVGRYGDIRDVTRH